MGARSQDDLVFVGHVPAPVLRPFVATAHGYRVPASPSGRHRGLPSRHLTLVVDLTEPLRVGGLGAEVCADAVLGGLHRSAALVDASRPQEGLQLALTPLGARRLLGVPAGELGGLALDLAAVLGPDAGRLVDQVRSARGWSARFAALDHALARRLVDAPALPAEVVAAWHLLLDGDGRRRVADVAREVGWSRRHLALRFREATGLGPKALARVARFEAVREMLLAPSRRWVEPGPRREVDLGSVPRPNLADVAAACGFADQSHLAREWRSLAGCSVTTWLAEEIPFVQDGAPGGGAAS